MRSALLRDLIQVAIQTGVPPAWTDEAAVAAWVGKFASSLVPVVYDVLQNDPPKAGEFAAEAPPSEIEIEAAYNLVVAEGGYAAIGDGHVIAWLKTLPWAQIISFIIAIVPKATP